MTTKTQKSAAEARKGVTVQHADLSVKILPNISLDKGEWARLTLNATRRVPHMVTDPKTGEVKDKSFNVHDVTFVEGSIEAGYVGKDEEKVMLTPGLEVSLKGNARLDRGFGMMKPGESCIIESLGLVKAGSFNANDYSFDIVK